MAELADALDLGSSAVKGVQVQVLFPAPALRFLACTRDPDTHNKCNLEGRASRPSILPRFSHACSWVESSALALRLSRRYDAGFSR